MTEGTSSGRNRKARKGPDGMLAPTQSPLHGPHASTALGTKGDCPLASGQRQEPRELLRHISTHVSAYRSSLNEAGFVEGRNIAIDFRRAEDRYHRFPSLAAELARLPV
jgi:hypothetical protein